MLYFDKTVPHRLCSAWLRLSLVPIQGFFYGALSNHLIKEGMFMQQQSPANMGVGKNLLLGIQHLFAMFGSTVLVPILTGLDPNVALFTAGLGTLIFHLCTKGKVPVFVGSSFAFIGVIQITARMYGGVDAGVAAGSYKAKDGKAACLENSGFG